MEKPRQIPDINRLSILGAIVLLAYSVTPFVNLPETSISITAAGIAFNFRINFNTFISILIPIFAAVGTYWLLQSHSLKSERFRWQHSIIPALTAWVIGMPLSRLTPSLQWWAVLALGGIFLIMVFIAEYVLVDQTNRRHTIAAGVIKAVSLSLFLFLAIALKALGLRLYLLIPALVIPLGLVCLRTFYLQFSGKWLFGWGVVIGIIVGQVAIGLHYLPINPVSFGLFLVALAYALLDFAMGYVDHKSLKKTWLEPVVMFSMICLLGFIFL